MTKPGVIDGQSPAFLVGLLPLSGPGAYCTIKVTGMVCEYEPDVAVTCTV